jgi:hypothetical protein
MRILPFFWLIAAFMMITACSTSKKSTGSTTSSSNSTTTVAGDPNSKPVYFNPNFNSPEAGINIPGDNELAALQPLYSDVTIEKLQEGYHVYTGASCTGCHGAKSIQNRPASRWKDIIDKMSEAAKLNESQKDAVYKYVLAVKAVQAKESK